MVNLISDFFKNYINFSGRTSRKDYWLTVLLLLIVSLVLGAILQVLCVIWELIILLPSLAICARRLRDAGFSPWWLLLLLTGIGGIVILIMTLLPKK